MNNIKYSMSFWNFITASQLTLVKKLFQFIENNLINIISKYKSKKSLVLMEKPI